MRLISAVSRSSQRSAPHPTTTSPSSRATTNRPDGSLKAASASASAWRPSKPVGNRCSSSPTYRSSAKRASRQPASTTEKVGPGEPVTAEPARCGLAVGCSLDRRRCDDVQTGSQSSAPEVPLRTSSRGADECRLRRFVCEASRGADGYVPKGRAAIQAGYDQASAVSTSGRSFAGAHPGNAVSQLRRSRDGS